MKASRRWLAKFCYAIKEYYWLVWPWIQYYPSLCIYRMYQIGHFFNGAFESDHNYHISHITKSYTHPCLHLSCWLIPLGNTSQNWVELGQLRFKLIKIDKKNHFMFAQKVSWQHSAMRQNQDIVPAACRQWRKRLATPPIIEPANPPRMQLLENFPSRERG